MNKTEIISKVTRTFNRASLEVKKHSPEILVAAGVVGVVTSAVMACKATTKVDAIMAKAKERVDGVHDTLNEPEMKQAYFDEYQEEYTEEQSKKDLAVVYAQTGIEFIKLYGPAVLLGAVSLAAIVKSHDILRKRNIAVAAAYATVDRGFKEYRSRVVERFGKELDRELRYNIKQKEVEEIVINEDGTEQTVKNTVSVVDPNTRSEFTKCFDETCAGWMRDSEKNYYFLKQQQTYANQLLKEQGYLFLNDVYKMLGFQPTTAGQVVGWIYDDKDPIGDNFVDFDIFDLHDEQKRAFVNGYEKSIWLDFNVDGVIYDLLG